MDNWLALVIGNSRSHWAWFQEHTLITAWDSPHLATTVNQHQLPSEVLTAQLSTIDTNNIPIYMASVVSSQTALWQRYQNIRQITLQDIPLSNLYPTLGVDRALAVWGAGETYGYPCLVIDGGTALTITGLDEKKSLVGGAILPGIRTQLQSLYKATAALPEITLPQSLPTRWANNTPGAIASGVIYSVISGVQSFIDDWQATYPHSAIIITGGDREFLASYLRSQDQIAIDSNLIFQGISLLI
ncbi:pantothenate kinase, type III [Xenococcus sp. PCC 7305]|uniref:pantothenate kinase n=1 Tax=Xenococcus sp. PCC 7305 TaxID=102125 RepID=UPI0002AC614A|nr:pantothenate kinase [Xenococcus sp. PCC 7305]ELS04066.1 pantothenate kinase, type III [Xenococcus sp. PCC 7305]